MTVGVLQVQTRRDTLDRRSEHQLDDLVRQTGDHLSAVRMQAETTRQAGTDPLTGVPFADLDRFQQLTDTHGHGIGDRVLRLFAGVLQSSLRPDDVIACADAALLTAKHTGRDRAVLHELTPPTPQPVTAG